MKIILSIALLILFTYQSYAQIRVQDDAGQMFVFDQPVQKIISLAPHITENLYAAGADKQLIATVSYSDYPEQAKYLPVIGDHNKYDFEAIIKLKPELIIAWKSGNPANQISQLKKLGFKVFINDPFQLDDVARSIEVMGQLIGTESVARAEAARFRSGLQQLSMSGDIKRKVSVFYQVWDEPLITINNQHIINHVIRLCDGNNIFGDLPVLAPRVSIESVLLKNPEVIVSGMAKGRESWLESWQQWENISAVKQNHLFAIKADWITRHTPRILLAAEKMCAYLDRVRNKQ